MNIRTSVSIYRSSIAALSGPNNRLDGQQPWSANFGFDQRISGLPLNVGGNLSYTPGYETLQSTEQLFKRTSVRGIDLFAMMTLNPKLSVRAAASAGVQQFGPPNGRTLTQYSNGDYFHAERYAKPQFNLTMDMKL